jgi:hypothetical protein
MPRAIPCLIVLLSALTTAALAAGHEEGRRYMEQHGYQGPATCETCHPGTAREFLQTVHWKHASRVTNVENLPPGEYGMKNRAYTMCNANEIVNSLREVPPNEQGKTKFTGCDSCHPGDQLSKPGDTGPAAEASIDCLLCHASKYDFSKRTVSKDEKGRPVMSQDRSLETALSVGRPGVKNCMTCHEASGGGLLVKRGFAFTAEYDVHAAKGMVCVDCHKGKKHKLPTGYDPNNWANDDNMRISCADLSCHGSKPHKDDDYNRHAARIACQTCHILRTGGSFAKDFVVWQKTSTGFYEPSTLMKEANENTPVYAWYNRTVRNTPHFIGPKGVRGDKASKIYPFKVFQGRAYFDKKTDRLMVMDFSIPMANGDTLAGVRSAAKTLGIASYTPVPGWQTVYFGNNHLVSRSKALSCENCHAPNGLIRFAELGYSSREIKRLTSPEIYFNKLLHKQKEEW